MSKTCIRCSTVFAGIYTLVQSLVWAIAAIYFLSVFTCQLSNPFNDETNSNTTSYLIYLSYFRGYCRTEENSPRFESDSAKRTYAFLMAYSIISSIWLPTAVLILVASVKKIRGSHTKYFYLPWMLITLIISILDVVATVEYSMDISKTMTIREYRLFVRAPAPLLEIGGSDGITVLPAIIMSLAVSRGVILWIVNVALLAFSVQGLCTFSKNKIDSKKDKNSRNETAATQGGKHNMRRIKPIAMEERPKNGGNQWGSGGAVNRGYVTDNPNELDERRKETGLENFGYMADEPLRVEPSRIEVSRVLEDLDKKVDEADATAVAEGPHSLEEEVRAGKKMNRRVYDAYGNPTDESLTPPYRNKLSQPKQELSGYQKPWSYTMPPLEQLKVKQDSVQGVERPPIPVPDYSVRASKRKYTNLDSIGEPTAYNNNNISTK